MCENKHIWLQYQHFKNKKNTLSVLEGNRDDFFRLGFFELTAGVVGDQVVWNGQAMGTTRRSTSNSPTDAAARVAGPSPQNLCPLQRVYQGGGGRRCTAPRHGGRGKSSMGCGPVKSDETRDACGSLNKCS